MLASSSGGISKHTELLKSLIKTQDDEVEKEHCKGMEGLVKEAIKHTDRRGARRRAPCWTRRSSRNTSG